MNPPIETVDTPPTDLATRRPPARTSHWRRNAGLLAGGLVVAAGAAWWIGWQSPLLAVDSISVRGTTTLDPDQVRAAAQVALGTPLAAVDTEAVTARLRALPRAGEVEVRRGFPRELVLVVEERVPVAVVAAGSGWRTIDAQGREVADLKSRPARLPLVSASGVGLDSALGVLASLPKALAAQTQAISASTRDDVELVLRSGDRVRWGDPSQPGRKAAVLAALLTRPGTVYDVSVPDLPTVTE